MAGKKKPAERCRMLLSIGEKDFFNCDLADGHDGSHKHRWENEKGFPRVLQWVDALTEIQDEKLRMDIKEKQRQLDDIQKELNGKIEDILRNKDIIKHIDVHFDKRERAIISREDHFIQQRVKFKETIADQAHEIAQLKRREAVYKAYDQLINKLSLLTGMKSNNEE